MLEVRDVPFAPVLIFTTLIGIDLKFVRTVNGLPPTPQTALPLNKGDTEGRGSVVLFNQATMFQSSETDSSTLKEALAAGINTDGRYSEMMESQFKREDFLGQRL